jgi:hypothetical protein
MPKNPKKYQGDLPAIPSRQIYLNIDHLEKGEYLVKITLRNKIIKHITFQKK